VTFNRMELVGTSALETSRADRGAEAAREALRISAELRDSSGYVALLHNELANNESRLGYTDEAIRQYRLAVEIAKKDGNPKQKSMILSNPAGVYGELNQHREAIEILREALEVAIPLDLKPVLAGTYVAPGDNFFAIGDPEQANQNYRNAELESQEPAMRSFLAAAALGLGDLAVRQKRFDDARSHFRTAQDIYTAIKDPSGVLSSDTRLNQLNQTDDLSQKITSLEETLKKAEDTGDSRLIQETARNLAVLYEETNDFQNATKMLRRAMDLQVESWNLAHADELARTKQLLDREKIKRLQEEAAVRQSDLEHQRRQNAMLLVGLLIAAVSAFVFLIVLVDRRNAILELKSAEAKVRQQKQLQIAMERQLAEQQRTESMGLMAAGIAHDFNNLLTVISGSAEIGTLEVDPEQKNALFRQITTVSFQAADLTKQLRQFLARPNEGHAVSRLQDVVESMVPLLKSVARPPVHVEVQSEATGLHVGIDEAQLRQIILNLVSNCVDASPADGGRVMIRLSSCILQQDELDRMRGADFAEPGLFCRIEVTDEGPGIPEEIQRRVFDPYFSTKAVGRGLGLASVLGIIRSCRGASEVISQKGQGTTFRVFIPQVAESAVVQKLPTASNVRSRSHSNPGERGTILLVDDEPFIRKSINDVLVNSGYETQTAEDALAVLKILPSISDRLSLAIIDYSMPGESGVWLAERLNEQRSGLPVIICSGYTPESIAITSNVRKFLQKPYLPSDLLSKIRRCLDAA
jgi:signal transduction histidine kinase